MIETVDDSSLTIRFPDHHRGSRLTVSFQRTLRVPNDGKKYPLPAGLGRFPIRHVDDYADRVPERWVRNGGVFLPMYQGEAMWLNFDLRQDSSSRRTLALPMAMIVGAGKINAVTGEPLELTLGDDPQSYVVVPDQPWLDGFCVEKGVIRQFVAMPLGSGMTVEEQLTGKAEHGGLQIVARPMRKRMYLEISEPEPEPKVSFGANLMHELEGTCFEIEVEEPSMGLAPGGQITQSIEEDVFGLSAWDQDESSRCFVHIVNSRQWTTITGEPMPTEPVTKEQYRSHGIPWFDYYDEKSVAVPGSSILGKLMSVFREEREPRPTRPSSARVREPEDASELGPRVKLRRREGKVVREW